MANRNFNRFQALEKEAKVLYADVSIGTLGAPTIDKALGIASIARSSAGLYVLTLQDKYNRLLDCQVSIVAPSAEDLKAQLVSEDVDNAKTISFRTIDSTASLVDPASGDRLLIQIHVKNSSV